MKFRGNNLLFFIIEICAGILIFFLTKAIGDAGLWGLILFFAGLILTRNQPDEREMILIYRVTTLEGFFWAK